MNSNYSQPRRVLVAASVCVLLAAGCSYEPERGPVNGVVTLDGKPLPNVMVIFVPDPKHGTPGQRSVALTDKDGRYVVFTDKDQNGASVGIHRVSLYDPLAITSSNNLLTLPIPGQAKALPEPKAPPRSRIPAAYTDASKTPLQPVAVGRESQTYDIHLKSK